MSFKALLQPALYVMNKLSFKVKIIASITLLFLLLLFPSRAVFMDYIKKSNTYDKQLIGVTYIETINSFIKTIQEHRTLSIEYLQGNKELLEDLEDVEFKFYKQKSTIMDYDQKALKLLSSNQNFAKATALFEIMKQEKFDNRTSVHTVFSTHNEMVERLLKTVREISGVSTFAASKDLRINYLADMLQEKLLRLYETTRQLHDSSVNLVENEIILKEQKLILYSLFTDLSSLQLNLKENKLLSFLTNYHALEEETTAVTYNITELMNILDSNIIMGNQHNTLHQEEFLIKIVKGMEMQESLYERFIYTYKDTVENLKANLTHKWLSLFGLFMAILAIAFYIFIAFYQSITSNLKKLQTASEMISKGQTKIKLEVDKKDEIGDALLAFNTMSEKLSENIAFLDGYKRAIDKSSIVSKTDTKGIITYVNKMFCDVSGYTEKELLGRSHNIIRHSDNSRDIFEDMWNTIEAKKIWKGILKNKNKDGSAYIVNATVLPILDSDNNILEYVAVRHDITELETSKEEIQKQRTDLLTGLPNRNQLLVDLKTAIKPIVFYLNIDDFSGFNDFYGSSIGDDVLMNISKILDKLQAKKHLKVYKLQADQFILLFEEESLVHQNFQIYFTALLEEIELKISSIVLENQNSINLSVTGGVATYYAHDNYQKLILYANIARKRAQLEHRKMMLFEHTMRKSEDYAKNIEWIKKIKEAIDEDRIATYYQPIIDNKTGKALKYETLVRMLDRDGIPVSTWTFLEIAQKSKLYPQVTKIVIEKSFEMFKDLPLLEFSLNLTVDDILSKETTNFIYDKLEKYENSHNVIFEITESEEVNDYKIINDFIKRVKQHGVKIAIDDFGSGFANFEHIINIDADFIKIDGSLIKNIDTDMNAKIITEAIISFSAKLGRKTITEFVHNEEIYHIVKELGADYSQGYYFGAPSPKLI